MKSINLAITFIMIFMVQNSQACGNSTYGLSDSATSKCVEFDRPADVAATPEEAERLENDLKKFGGENLLKYCTHEKSQAYRVQGKDCGSESSVGGGICSVNAELKCTWRGKIFPMKLDIFCKPSFHDCGVFEDCVNDDSVTSQMSKLRNKSDFVPKGFSIQGQGVNK